MSPCPLNKKHFDRSAQADMRRLYLQSRYLKIKDGTWVKGKAVRKPRTIIAKPPTVRVNPWAGKKRPEPRIQEIKLLKAAEELLKFSPQNVRSVSWLELSSGSSNT